MTLRASPAATLETLLAAVRLVLWVHESVPGSDRREFRALDAHLHGAATLGHPLTLTAPQADALASALELALLRPGAAIMARLQRDLTEARVHQALAVIAPARTYTLDELLGGAA